MLVKRNICRGLLPPCEMFGWILLAQQSELHFKHCWLNLALTGAAPYWAVTEYVLSRSPSTVPNFLSASRPARQKSMDCSVWQGIQGTIALQKSCTGKDFVGLLTVFRGMFKLKLVKHLYKTSKWIFTLASCSIKLYKLWKFNLSLLSLLGQLSVSAKLISFCLRL